MVAPNNYWFSYQKMIILVVFWGGNPPFKETPTAHRCSKTSFNKSPKASGMPRLLPSVFLKINWSNAATSPMALRRSPKEPHPKLHHPFSGGRLTEAAAWKPVKACLRFVLYFICWWPFVFVWKNEGLGIWFLLLYEVFIHGIDGCKYILNLGDILCIKVHLHTHK